MGPLTLSPVRVRSLAASGNLKLKFSHEVLVLHFELSVIRRYARWRRGRAASSRSRHGPSSEPLVPPLVRDRFGTDRPASGLNFNVDVAAWDVSGGGKLGLAERRFIPTTSF